MVVPITMTFMLHRFLTTIIISALASNAFAQSPMLTEVMNFAPIPVGAKRELRAKVKGLPPGGTYQVVQAPLQPFTVTSTGSDLTVRGDEIEIRVVFEPLSEGDFRDEIILQRSPSTGQPVYDAVRVRLFGTAFRIERTDDLDFGNVMTGDTAKQAVLYRVNRNDDFLFQFLGSLREPFYLLTAQEPVRRGFDTLAVVIAFSPKAPGKYADTIGVVRRDRQGRNLDTSYIEVYGNGRSMLAEVTVDLRDLTAGDYATRSVKVDLPARVYSTEFSYTVESRAAAPYTQARITSPTTASKTQNIVVEVVANPQKRVDERSSYMLLRKGANNTTVDSTRIVLDVAAASRPNSWTATFGPEPINARIGDTLELTLKARTTNPVDSPTQVQSITYTFSYNPTVFVPLLEQNQKLSVVDNRQVVTTTIDAFAQPLFLSEDGDVIATLRAVVAMGDAESMSLDVTQIQCIGSDGKPLVMESASTLLRISNAWRYATGGVRLVNSLQGVLTLDVDPNPVETVSTLRIRNLPQGVGQVAIVDELGQVRQDLTNAVRSGKRDFLIATSGNADVVLGPGTYYARCVVESILGNTLNSIVRLFVVK